jgi:hypothetical protein
MTYDTFVCIDPGDYGGYFFSSPVSDNKRFIQFQDYWKYFDSFYLHAALFTEVSAAYGAASLSKKLTHRGKPGVLLLT